MRSLMAFSLAKLTLMGTLTGAALAARPAAACDRDDIVVTRREIRAVQLAEDTVRFRDADVYRVRLAGGERIRLVARGNGDLNLVIRDDCGRVVAADREDDHVAAVRFVPRYTGAFTVTVVNRERDDVDYRLVAE